MGATGVGYIQMSQASQSQDNNTWDLEETIRQAEQTFTTDPKATATETTNDEKLLKTSVCLERRTIDQILEQNSQNQQQLSTLFDVVFYDHQFIIPQSLRNTIIMLLHKVHVAI